MIEVLLKEILKQFSLKALYLEICWFATFGYLMHIFVVSVLTRLPFNALPKSIAKLHFASMAASYIIAPELAALSILISKFYSLHYQTWFVGQQVYVWYMVCMMLFSSYLLCKFFVTVTCHRFRMWLVGINLIVGVLGFFVLKAMNLLVIN